MAQMLNLDLVRLSTMSICIAADTFVNPVCEMSKPEIKKIAKYFQSAQILFCEIVGVCLK